MSSHTPLFQFVALVIPLSLIGVGFVLDQYGGKDVPTNVFASSLLKAFLVMTTAFVLSAWAAVLQEITPATIPYLVEAGYLFAAIGLTVPMVVVWWIKDEEDIEVF